MIPNRVFLTKGLGIHKDYLSSFELALRSAGIEICNLVYVSSILPPNCKIISREAGVKELVPGQITYCVMSKNATNEPSRLISSSIGIAIPKDRNNYGYISEHHGYGEVAKKSSDYAEDLAATMLATTLGIPFDVDVAWDERKQIYEASNHIFRTKSVCQSAEGNKNGLWTFVIAAAVFLMD
ncbi:MAG: arginine decarboxylase, pyruvoyl-dependent [Deferribacterota bacterium]|nr:arginine decarboxylase, pyruvoyl-dependent [Deferribacterota bacterium]